MKTLLYGWLKTGTFMLMHRFEPQTRAGVRCNGCTSKANTHRSQIGIKDREYQLVDQLKEMHEVPE